MFKKLSAKFGGSGGAKVETTLDNEEVEPGGTISGSVVARGGEVQQVLQGVRVGLSAIVEVEGEDSEWDSTQVFNEVKISDGLTLDPGDEETLTFELTVPHELPPNVIGGQPMGKIRLGVATILEIEKAVDAKDSDPIRVTALPAQAATMQAMSALGFSFKGADLEKGRIRGAELGFYAEYEFYAHGTGYKFNEAELTFVTRAGDMDVILEVDKKGGWISEGHDAIRSITIPTSQGDADAIAAQLRGIFDAI